MNLNNILSINGINIEEYLSGKYYKNISSDKNYEYNITGFYSSQNYTFNNKTIQGNFDLISNNITYENLELKLNNLENNTFSISNIDSNNSSSNLNITAKNFNSQLISNTNSKFYSESALTLCNNFNLNCNNFNENRIYNLYNNNISCMNIVSNIFNTINNLDINNNICFNNIYNQITNFNLKCNDLTNVLNVDTNSTKTLSTITKLTKYNDVLDTITITIYSGIVKYPYSYYANSSLYYFKTGFQYSTFTNTNKLTYYEKYNNTNFSINCQGYIDNTSGSGLVSTLGSLSYEYVNKTSCSFTFTLDGSSISSTLNSTQSILTTISNISYTIYHIKFLIYLTGFGVSVAIKDSVTAKITNQTVYNYEYNYSNITNLNLTNNNIIYNQAFNKISNLNIVANNFGFSSIDYHNMTGNLLSSCTKINVNALYDINNNYVNNINVNIDAYSMIWNNYGNINFLNINCISSIRNNYIASISSCNIDGYVLSTNTLLSIRTININNISVRYNVIRDITCININTVCEVYVNTFENINNCNISASTLYLNSFINNSNVNLTANSINSLGFTMITKLNISCDVLESLVISNNSIITHEQTVYHNIENINITCNSILPQTFGKYNKYAINNLNIQGAFKNRIIYEPSYTIYFTKYITNSSYTSLDINTYNWNVYLIENCINAHINLSANADFVIVRNVINCTFNNVHNISTVLVNGNETYTKYGLVVLYNVSNLILNKGFTDSNNMYVVGKVGSNFESSLLDDCMKNLI